MTTYIDTALFVKVFVLEAAKHSGATGTRSLDLWHVAAALESGCTAFASYDARQRKVAAGCALNLVPNMSPSHRPKS